MKNMDDDYKIESGRMVDEQLITRGIRSDSVLEAMRNVPRHLLVPENLRGSAYSDTPLPIGFGQTISQPYIVAYMTEQLEPIPGKKVLEIGTGSGYQTAILAYLGCDVYTVEVCKELANRAEENLTAIGFDNVKVKHGDGYSGWPSAAPFDAIIVTAAPEIVPDSLVEQLGENGKMIVPVGEVNATQQLKLITKSNGQIVEDSLILVRFVPMLH